MAKDNLLVIDNGGTNTKAVLFTVDGVQIGSSSFPTPRIDLPGQKREVDMDEMWTSVTNAITLLLENTGVSGDSIAGISTVGHGKGLYVVDKEGKVFRNGILSTDNRGWDTVEKVSQHFDEIASISEQPVLAVQSPILLRWLKDNEREQYDQIGGIMSAKDYVRYRLTDEIYGEYSDASGNNFLNLHTREYDQRLFELFGIEEMYEVVPELKNFDDICGTTTKEVERLTGIKEGTPVVGGMFDINASAIATKVLDDSLLCMVAGTWSINEYLSPEPAELKEGVMNSLFVDGKHYLVESSSATSAGNLDIILELLDADSDTDKDDLYKEINRYLKNTDANTTDIIFLPFLYGSNAHPQAKGTFVGLDSSTSRLELIRSVYEGVVFSQKTHMDHLLEVKSTETRAIRLSGGVINSLEWVQIFADVLDFPIEIVEANELGALGGAIGAALGIGLYDNLEDASEKMTRIKQTIQPRPEETKLYKEKYKRYRNVVEALDNVWE